MTILPVSPDPDEPSQSEIDFLRWREQQAIGRAKFVGFTNSLAHKALLEKADLAGLMLVMLFPGHGCACDSTGICAAHSQAYQQLREAHDALEAAIASLQKASEEYKP